MALVVFAEPAIISSMQVIRIFAVLAMIAAVGVAAVAPFLPDSQPTKLDLNRMLATGMRNALSKKPRPMGQEMCTSAGLSVIPMEDNGSGSTFGFHEGQFVAVNRTATELLVWVYSQYPARMQGRDLLPRGLFNVRLPCPSGDVDEALQHELARAFEEAFHLKLSMQDRTVDAWVLSVVPGSPPDGLLPPVTKGGMESGTTENGMEFYHTTMPDFCDWIEKKTRDRPVLDETNIEGTHHIILPAETAYNARRIPQAVRDLGLNFKIEKRPVRELIIEPVAK